MKLQNTSQSLIWWVGLIACITQGVLGVLMQAGLLTADMCGAVMTAFAILLQWCNSNSPAIMGQYSASPAQIAKSEQEE